jgi:hypothetical protein
VERETAVSRKQVEDAETVIKQEQEDMRSAESGGLISSEPGYKIEEMLDAIGDSQSDFASSDDEEDRDDDADTEQGKLSKDDEPSWVMGTISKTVQQRIEWFWPKQMKLDEITQLGWGDAVDYIHERDQKYGTTELKVLAFVKPYTHNYTAK